jgi:hypothetical protein
MWSGWQKGNSSVFSNNHNPNHTMANIYDRVIKEIIEPALRPLAEIALGLRFGDALEIEDKIQYTLEREADHLKM